MPTPNPKPEENQADFIGRCMKWASDNEGDMPQEQQLAMCYSVFRKSRGTDITKSDLVTELIFEKGRLEKIIIAKAQEDGEDTP